MSDPARPCRVAWVANGDEGYGVGVATTTLMDALARRGHAVGAVTLREGPLTSKLEGEGRLIACLRRDPPRTLGGSLPKRALIYLRNRRNSMRAAPDVARELRAWRADSVHVLWPSLITLAGAAARRAGALCFWEVPNVVSDRYPFAINRRLIQRTCKRYAIQPLANSAYTARSLGDKPVKPIVFHLGVNADRFDPANIEPVPRDELGVAPGVPVFGIFGWFSEIKGQRRLIEAAAAVARDTPVHVLCVGGPLEGPDADPVRDAARALHAPAGVTLLDRVPDPERYMLACDVVVTATAGVVEAFGLTVVEAMLLGRPVLAHALGGPAETVVDGVTGWHVPSADPEALADGIRRALRARERWPAIAGAAREHALARFTDDAEADRFLDILAARLPRA